MGLPTAAMVSDFDVAFAGFGVAAGAGCLLLSCPMVGLLNKLGSMPPRPLSNPAMGSPLPRPDAMLWDIGKSEQGQNSEPITRSRPNDGVHGI